MPPRKRRIRVTWLDVLVIAVVAGVAAYLAYRVNSVLRYTWNWSLIPPFVLRWDAQRQEWVANLILQGFLSTIRISIWAALLAAVIGTVMGLCRVSRSLFLRGVARLYVELIRNVPPLVFIFVFFFFVTSQLTPVLGIDQLVRDASAETRAWIGWLFGPPQAMSAVVAGLLCLALFEGAYVTEVVRAGVQSIAKGQWEAAGSLGLTRLQTLRDVILPQAFQRVVPPLAGQFISLVKDSSIVSLISVPELTFLASEVAASTGRVFEVWIVVSMFYFLLCFGLSLGFARIEARLGRSSM